MQTTSGGTVVVEVAAALEDKNKLKVAMWTRMFLFVFSSSIS